jgi:glucan endo-1,3-beta-D-glucosidase
MRVSSTLLAGALAASAEASKNYLGFNSGATLPDRSAKFKADFKEEFETAQNLQGAPGKFNAVRLYTNIQAYSTEDPIEAFEAAIETDTSILLGVWASGVTNIDKEISALEKALKKYGDDLAKLVIGISIGSEDLYRVSATGVENKSGEGNGPDEIIGFIGDFKKAFANTALSKIPVGHVDTWDSWDNTTNHPVIDAVDFLGVDEYPYYENDKGNDIKNSGQLFDKAYGKTLAAAKGKPVWVTETGWPATGPDWDEAEASTANAKYYWDEVGCRKLFNKAPTFWYNLRDSNPDNKAKFAITKNLSTKPLFDLSCPSHFETPDETTTASTKAAATKTKSSGASATDDSTASFSAPSTTGTSKSGSGSDSETDSTKTTSDSPSATGSGAAATTTDADDAATSVQLMSKAAYAALALVAGLAMF